MLIFTTPTCQFPEKNSQTVNYLHTTVDFWSIVNRDASNFTIFIAWNQSLEFRLPAHYTPANILIPLNFNLCFREKGYSFPFCLIEPLMRQQWPTFLKRLICFVCSRGKNRNLKVIFANCQAPTTI